MYNYLPNVLVSKKDSLKNLSIQDKYLLTNSSFPTKELAAILNKTNIVNDKEYLFVEPFIDIFTQSGVFTNIYEDKSRQNIIISFSGISVQNKKRLSSLYDFFEMYETESIIKSIIHKYEKSIESILIEKYSNDYEGLESLKKQYTVMSLLMTSFFYKKLYDYHGKKLVKIKNNIHLINISKYNFKFSFIYEIETIKDNLTFMKDFHSLHLSNEQMNDYIDNVYKNIVFGLKYDFMLNQLSTSQDEKYEIMNGLFSGDVLKLNIKDDIFEDIDNDIKVSVKNKYQNENFIKYKNLFSYIFKYTNIIYHINFNETTEYKSKIFKKNLLKKFFNKNIPIEEKVFNDFNKLHEVKHFEEWKNFIINMQNYLNLTYRYNKNISIMMMYNILKFFENIYLLILKNSSTKEELLQSETFELLQDELNAIVKDFFELITKDIKHIPNQNSTMITALEEFYEDLSNNRINQKNNIVDDTLKDIQKNFL